LVTAPKVFGTAALFGLLEAGVAGRTKALKLASPEQVGVATVRNHVVCHSRRGHSTNGATHSAQGLGCQLRCPKLAPSRSRVQPLDLRCGHEITSKLRYEMVRNSAE